MTNREALHQLIDRLPDEQAELARVWLEDLSEAADCRAVAHPPSARSGLELAEQPGRSSSSATRARAACSSSREVS